MTERGLEWNRVPAAIWRARRGILRPVTRLDPVRFSDLLGVDRQVAALRHNTERFLRGLPANNVLLWGARGTGKSSLIKALLNEYVTEGLRIIEVDKNDLLDLNDIIDDIRDESHRFVIYCDDLSFDAGESQYKALKSALEGSIELPPDNVLVYATSNRRHLLPEYMSDNDNSKVVDGELHHGEAVEEKISLSDRFGLWLSFYPISQDEYLNIVDHLFPAVQERSALHRAALKFAYTKGVRSGRAAKQFYRAYSGEFN
ncbi:MAG: ATP-binding protein [Pseudomonadales bacterium]|nr:ATP-binding protein [Pseudomonadales bacterium]